VAVECIVKEKVLYLLAAAGNDSEMSPCQHVTINPVARLSICILPSDLTKSLILAMEPSSSLWHIC